jgi:hypothetical protein
METRLNLPFKRWAYVCALTLAIASLIACGGGGDENSADITTSPTSKSTKEALAKVNLSTIDDAPYTVDSSNQAAWWSPMAEHGGNIYMAYNAPASTSGKHKVYVAKRSSSGTWSTGCLKNGQGNCVEYADDIGHNQPSIAIDGSGYIHVFASMHHVDWQYFRSNGTADVSDIRDRSSEMPDQNGQYTYPVMATTPDGNVWLIIRAQSTNGRAGRLYKWTNSSNTWNRQASFGYESGKTVYPDDIKVDSNGDLHIVFEWLGLNNGGPIRHAGSYLRYSPATNQFYKADGSTVAVPVTPSTAGVVYQPLQAGESFSDDASADDKEVGMQSAKLTLQSGSTKPHIVYRLRTSYSGRWTVKRARYSSGWQTETVYSGSYDTYAALGVSHNGSIARAYYVKNVNGKGEPYVAEKSSTGGWTETALASGKDVQRISVIRTSSSKDVLYMSAPSEGKLYYLVNDY